MNLSIERRLRTLEDTLEKLRKMDLPLYLEGSYTPTMTGGTSAGVTTYSVQAGEYTQFGRIIHVQGRVSWTAATGTGVIRISLPFTTANITNIFGAVALVTDAITFAGAAPQALVLPNVDYFELKYPVSNAATQDIAVEAAGSVFFSVTYIID